MSKMINFGRKGMALSKHVDLSMMDFALVCSCIFFSLSVLYGQTTSQTILLVDDDFILYRSGTKRTIQQAKRYSQNPVIPTTEEWEKTISYCSVHRDAESGKYQLWYQTYPGSYLSYAISDDGLKWTKPSLGIIEMNGSKDNNLVLKIGYGGSVIFDPLDPDPKRRYKSAFWDQFEKPYGLSVAWSPDGIHWTRNDKSPIIVGSYGPALQTPFEDESIIKEGGTGQPISTSDVNDLIWDPKRNVYAIYAKTWLDGPDGVMHWKRAVVRTESKDFEHWSKPELVMRADEFDGEWGDNEWVRDVGGGGGGGIQFHSAPAFYYNDKYFSLIQVMDNALTGLMPIELAISDDGYNWDRPFRNTFFIPPLEDTSKFDASAIWSNATPVFLQDEIRFYYGAYGKPWTSPEFYKRSGVGFASIPIDRFAGVSPIDKIGQITFKNMDLKDVHQILINANASGGVIRAEMLNSDGFRIRGFSRDDAIPIKGDDLSHTIRWNDKELGDLPPGEYRIRLHLENAEVFAMTLRRN